MEGKSILFMHIPIKVVLCHLPCRKKRVEVIQFSHLPVTRWGDWKVVSQGNPKQEGPQWKRWLRKFIIMSSEYRSSLIPTSDGHLTAVRWHPRFNHLNLSFSLAARYEIFRKYGPGQTKECLQTRSTWQRESTRDRLHPPVGSGYDPLSILLHACFHAHMLHFWGLERICKDPIFLLFVGMKWLQTPTYCPRNSVNKSAAGETWVQGGSAHMCLQNKSHGHSKLQEFSCKSVSPSAQNVLLSPLPWGVHALQL